MSNQYLLGIDLGTSGCKICFFTLDGIIKDSITVSYNTYYGTNGEVEQNPEEWWHAICDGIKTILSKTDILANQIIAIGVDGHSWTCIPVDEQGTCLRNAMIWLDRRATKQSEWMKKIIGEDILFNNSGNPVDPSYIVPKMLWIKENERQIYNKTYKFLQSNSYIVYKLTNQFSQEYSQAYGFSFFDIENGKMNISLCNELGIDCDLIPNMFHCHEIVGKVTKEAAKLTGLIEGIPVVAGGLDAACCALGAGVINEGDTQEQGGQAGGMSIQISNPVKHNKLILGYHVIPNQWLLQGGTVGGGGVLNWFNNQIAKYSMLYPNASKLNDFTLMSSDASEIQPGSDGLIFLPYMAGERSPIWDVNAKGVLLGLTYNKNRKHIIRAMMEGVAYSLRHNLKTAEEVGVNVACLNSVGGAASSSIWTQIKADITGKQINVTDTKKYATTLGVAILAGVGVGAYSSFEEAVSKTIKIQHKYNPINKNYEIYNKYYKIYIELYDKLKETFDEIVKIK